MSAARNAFTHGPQHSQGAAAHRPPRTFWELGGQAHTALGWSLASSCAVVLSPLLCCSYCWCRGRMPWRFSSLQQAQQLERLGLGSRCRSEPAMLLLLLRLLGLRA